MTAPTSVLENSATVYVEVKNEGPYLQRPIEHHTRSLERAVSKALGDGVGFNIPADQDFKFPITEVGLYELKIGVNASPFIMKLWVVSDITTKSQEIPVDANGLASKFEWYTTRINDICTSISDTHRKGNKVSNSLYDELQQRLSDRLEQATQDSF